MSPEWKLLLIYFVFVNGCAFAAYGIDKYKAKKNERKKQGHRQPYTKVEITAVNA